MYLRERVCVCVFSLDNLVRFIKEGCLEGMAFEQTDLNEIRDLVMGMSLS